MPNLVGAEIHWATSCAAVLVHRASSLLVLPRPVSLSVELSLILLSLVRLRRAWFGRAVVAFRGGAILPTLFTQAVVLAVAIFTGFRPLLLARLAFGFSPCDLARFALLLGFSTCEFGHVGGSHPRLAGLTGLAARGRIRRIREFKRGDGRLINFTGRFKSSSTAYSTASQTAPDA